MAKKSGDTSDATSEPHNTLSQGLDVANALGWSHGEHHVDLGEIDAIVVDQRTFIWVVGWFESSLLLFFAHEVSLERGPRRIP